MEKTLCNSFIVIEGIDGCGKGVVMEGVLKFLSEKGISFSDLREKISDFKSSRAILTCEPTNEGKGDEIRNKILKNLKDYSAMDVAAAFAQDRAQLYRNVIIPALSRGIFIIQDRSLISSLVYQLVQSEQNSEGMTQEEVMALPGNVLAIENPPGLVIVQQIEPEIAYSRLTNRAGKMDGTDFEKIGFLRKIAEKYRAGDWRRLLQSKGSKIIDLDCNRLDTPEMTQKAVIDIVRNYLG